MSSSGGAERLERMLSFLSMSSFFFANLGTCLCHGVTYLYGVLGRFLDIFSLLIPIALG
jgi:hypothetical protein